MAEQNTLAEVGGKLTALIGEAVTIQLNREWTRSDANERQAAIEQGSISLKSGDSSARPIFFRPILKFAFIRVDSRFLLQDEEGKAAQRPS